MLSKLQRLYRGLCWLMDVDCGMPWDMASLGELREQVTALEDPSSRMAARVAWSRGCIIDIAAIEERVQTLENQTPYACNIEPNAEDEAQHVYATVTDTDTKEVYEGRLPLTNAGQPASCDGDWEYDAQGVRVTPRSTFNTEPAICSPVTLTSDIKAPHGFLATPLTKMGLTAVTDAQFRKMAEYVVAALVNPSCDCRSEDAMVAAPTDALQAYAKGDR